MYHNFFIHSSVSGHLGCFHVLTIANSAAMNTGIYVSFRVVVFSGYMPSSGTAGSYGSFTNGATREAQAHLVKNPPAMQKTLVQFLVREDPLEKRQLPTPVFLGFHGGSVSKQSARSAGDPGSISGLGRSPRGERLLRYCLDNPHGQKSLAGCSPWGHKDRFISRITFSSSQSLSCDQLFATP